MSATAAWSEATEQSLLGAVLIKPEILAWLDVDTTSFYAPQNRAVWTAMVSLHALGLGVDEVTLEGELERSGVMQAIGGLAYIARLACACATAANADSYAATLEQYRITRELVAVAAEVQADDELFGEALLDTMLSKLGGIQRATANELTSVEDTMPEMVRRLIDDVDAKAKGQMVSSFIESGIGPLDEAIGGIPLGTVTAIGARPGGGKSSTLLTIGEHAASLGKVAVIFTTEDPRDRWNERLLAKHARVAVDRIYMRDLNPQELARLTKAADVVKSIQNLHIVHAHGMTAQEMTRIATILKANLVGIDYAQKVKAPEPRMKLHESIEASSKHFGDYAGKSGAALVILSQLSKDVEKESRRPMLSDLRYGDGLAQEAKLALLLHDPQSSSEPQLRELLVAKRNQGEKDHVVQVNFAGAYCRFSARIDRAQPWRQSEEF